jgi:hypothetical protein
VLDRDDYLLQWINHEAWGYAMHNYSILKVPAIGTVPAITTPASAQLTDLLCAACVDFAVLPRGYVEEHPQGR